MRSPRTVYTITAGIALFTAAAIATACIDEAARTADVEGGIPTFEVDPLWPKPLPNHWILGSTIGVSVDSRDHVWIIHRGDSTLNPANESNAAQNPPTGLCCSAAPPVLEFDPDGNLVGWWGGPGDGYDWPQSNHGITVDPMDNVWIGGNAQGDSHILKFTRSGEFLLQIGKPGMRTGSNDTENFWRVAEVSIDADANEAYVADGYGNKRVAVLDMQTGVMKRYWGAYGNVPDDSPLPPYDPSAPPAQQFRSPMHCAAVSHDDLVYACDRAGDRIQEFTTDGTFIREAFIAPETLGSGSAWDIAFSHDPEQAFIYLADGTNKIVHVIERSSLEVKATFGDGGRQPGQFYGVHSLAVDSRGNLYTTETYEGKRLQKFVYMGLRDVSGDLGVPWPGTPR